MGYWDPPIQIKESDVLAIFRFRPQEDVDTIEFLAALAEKTLTAAWTLLWTNIYLRFS